MYNKLTIRRPHAITLVAVKSRERDTLTLVTLVSWWQQTKHGGPKESSPTKNKVYHKVLPARMYLGAKMLALHQNSQQGLRKKVQAESKSKESKTPITKCRPETPVWTNAKQVLKNYNWQQRTQTRNRITSKPMHPMRNKVRRSGCLLVQPLQK